MTSNDRQPPQIALVLFVCATFAFIAPGLFFPDAPPALRITLIAIGFVALIAGMIRLRRELPERRTGRDSRGDEPPAA